MKFDYTQEYVPVNLFGKDHWSTFAYVETVMVDKKCFKVQADPRMRSGRRNFRVMIDQSDGVPEGIHPFGYTRIFGTAEGHKYPTRLNDGSEIEKHDDWDCLQDCAAAGFFTVQEIEPGVELHLSDLGHKVANQLREHKRKGGNFHGFVPDVDGINEC